MSADDNFLVQAARAAKISGDDLPKMGEWYWVLNPDNDDADDEESDAEKSEPEWELMCAAHVGSNHTRFELRKGEFTGITYIMHWDALKRTRPEPNWREIIQRRIEEKQIELKSAVKQLADTFVQSNLIASEDAPQVESMLPTTTRVNPEAHKQALVTLKNTTLPKMEESIAEITKEIVGLSKNLFLPDQCRMERLTKASKAIDERLFALELYAGFGETAVCIKKGNPPTPDTPITVRQMLRYMDEELLIDLEEGGMDFSKLDDFQAWIAEPDNMVRMLPEPRCIVAFQVRRHGKEYVAPTDLANAIQQFYWHELNKATYLVIRNGEQVWMIATDTDFKPRLIPLKDEFNRPFKEDRWFDKDKDNEKLITPKDRRYDEYVEKRGAEMRHYNRVMFLLQGLLDRSKVFHPHPPIALNDPDAIEQWIKLKRDEEEGLPSWNPPKWKDYQANGMKAAKKGDIIYANYVEWVYGRFGKSDKVRHSGYYRFEGRIKKTGSSTEDFKLSEAPGTRYGWERPNDSWDRGEWGEWPYKRRKTHRVHLEECFNCETYQLGDYKKFLTDPYLKGAYTEWALFLLKAERYKAGKVDKSKL